MGLCTAPCASARSTCLPWPSSSPGSVGSPRCSRMARTPQGAVRYASTRRLPPRLPQANTSSAKLLRSSPAQFSRGVRSWVGSSLVAARASSPHSDEAYLIAVPRLRSGEAAGCRACGVRQTDSASEFSAPRSHPEWNGAARLVAPPRGRASIYGAYHWVRSGETPCQASRAGPGMAGGRLFR